MGIYSPIRVFLEARNAEQIPVTFAEIENIIGRPLPASKQYPAWWSNNPSNNPMTREWLTAGYETEQVDIVGKKLVFRKVRKPAAEIQFGGREKPAAALAAGFEGSVHAGLDDVATKRRYSIFGCLKGTMALNRDVDLAAPDEETMAWIDRKYGRK